MPKEVLEVLQSDMLQFIANIQSWSTSWASDMSGMSTDEASCIQKHLQSLTSRQMKLIGR